MAKYQVELEDGNQYEIESDHEPTQQEAQSAISQFHDRPSFQGAATREAGRSALPIAGGMAAASIAAAPFTGGTSLLLPIAASIIGGIGGYAATRKAQDVVADSIAPGSMFGTTSQQEDVKYQPYGTMLGGLLPAGIPSPTGLYRAGASVLTDEGRQALSRVINYARTNGVEAAAQQFPQEYEALNHTLGIFGNAGIGAAQGVMEGQSPSDVALNTAGMALFNKGWFHHPSPTENARRVATAGFAEPHPDQAKYEQGLNDPTQWSGTPPDASQPTSAVQTPEETPNVPAMDANGNYTGGKTIPELDREHEQIADQITNNPVAKSADAAVEQLAQSDAPLTAQVLNQTKEKSRDMEMVTALRTPAEEQAQTLHDAQQEAIKQKQSEEDKSANGTKISKGQVGSTQMYGDFIHGLERGDSIRIKDGSEVHGVGDRHDGYVEAGGIHYPLDIITHIKKSGDSDWTSVKPKEAPPQGIVEVRDTRKGSTEHVLEHQWDDPNRSTVDTVDPSKPYKRGEPYIRTSERDKKLLKEVRRSEKTDNENSTKPSKEAETKAGADAKRAEQPAAEPAPAKTAEESQPAKSESVAQEAGASKEPPLPKALAGAKPRYGYRDKNFDLNFESDVDKAAYITARASRSAAHDQYLNYAKKATGLSEAELKAHGKTVSDTIKAMAKDSNAEELTVPKHEISEPKPKENESKTKNEPGSAKTPSQQAGDSGKASGNGSESQEVTPKRRGRSGPAKKTEPTPAAPEPSEDQAARIGARLLDDKEFNKLVDSDKIEEANARKAEITQEELSRVPAKLTAEPAKASEAPTGDKVPEAPSGFSERLSEHLGEAASKWKPEDIENARKYVENGDEEAYRKLSGPKQSALTRFAAKDAPERARQAHEQARKVAGETITTEDGTSFTKDKAYNAKEGQGNGMVDLEPNVEDPETGLKTTFSAKEDSSDTPAPNPETVQKAVDAFTERHPFLKGKIILQSSRETLKAYGEENPLSKRTTDQAVQLLDKKTKIGGFVDNEGNIHLYTSNLPDSQTSIERLLAHELFHRGEEYAKTYAPEDYAKLQKAKAQIKDVHLEALGDGPYKNIYPDWRTDETQKRGLQTEWITKQIENGALEKAAPDSVLGKIWEALKNIWAKVTGNKNPTSQDIQDMYRAMVKAQEGRVSPKAPFDTKFSDFKASVASQVKENLEKTKDDFVQATKDAVRTADQTIRSVVEAGRGTPVYTEAKKAVGTLTKEMTVDNHIAKGKIETFVKQVPSARKRAAITVFRQADGDMATLQKWEKDTASKNKDFSRAAKEAQSLDQQGQYWADQMSDWYEQDGIRAVKSGQLPADVMKNGSDTYANGVWQKKVLPKGRDAYNQFVGKLQRNFNFGKKASFENFYEGVMGGFKPKTLDAAHLYSLYTTHLSKVIHTNEFIKNLVAGKAQDGKPLAMIRGADVTSDNSTTGSKILDPSVAKRMLDSNGESIPYKSSPDPRLWGWKWVGQDSGGKDVIMKGDLAFHPEAFKIVDNMLRRSALKEWADSPSESATAELLKRGFSAVDSINSGVKMGMFGFSPFHMVQEGTQALGHRINPLTDLKDFDPSNPVHLDAVQHGMTLPGTEADSQDIYEGLTSSGWMHKIPGAGPVAKVISDTTWKYVRSLKLKTYEKALEGNLKTFKGDIASGKTSVEDVKHLTATQMNESYGGLNYKMMGRNPTVQHLMRLTLLAPDFLEARFRASASAVHGLTGAKAGREQTVALAALTMVSYTLARALNGMLNNGDTKTDHPFSVVSGNREYTMRSLPEDIYKMISDPRKFAMGRISPFTTKTAIELGTGRNYRGESISATEALKNTALAGMPMSMRDFPGLSQLTQTTRNNPVSPVEALMSTFGLHISKFSPVNEAYDIAGKYKDSIGKPDTGVYPVSQYTPLKNALEDVDTAKAQSEIQKLKATMKPDALAKALHASIFHPWQDTAAEEIKFIKSLTPEKRAIVKAAEARKVAIWQKYVKLTNSGQSLPQRMPEHRS